VVISIFIVLGAYAAVRFYNTRYLTPF